MVHRSIYSVVLLSVILLVCGLIGVPRAEIPRMVSYQGKVTDSGGTPVADGNYTMRFRIYNSATGGTVQWDSGDRTIAVSGGVFNVLLGESPQPILNLDFDTDYWLLVTFSGTDQSPRQRLTAAGYAYIASGLVPGTEVIGSVTTWPFAAIKAAHTSTYGGLYYGVYGETRTTQVGMGVFGKAEANEGAAEGVRGESDATDGTGVAGYSTSSTGTGTGVYGGTSSPDGVGVIGSAGATTGGGYGVYGRTWSYSSSSHAVHAEVMVTGNGHAKGVYAVSDPNDGYGYGVYADGGYRGVYGKCTHSSSGQVTYGVYGGASGGSTNYGVYASGDMGCSGAKPAIVRTEDGPKAIYAQESPEIWFEDFGEDEIVEGEACVQIAGDFLQTITINEQHPMKVFVAPNADLGRWWVEKGTTEFVLHAPNAPDGAKFDYRIVAKRKGYEDYRLRPEPGSYSDHFLYPDLNDVPPEYRDRWIEDASYEERVRFGLPLKETTRLDMKERRRSSEELMRSLQGTLTGEETEPH